MVRSFRAPLVLDRVEERVAHAHTAAASLLCCWATLVVLAGSEPSSPPFRRESSIVVKAVSELIVLTPAEYAVSWLGWLVEGSIDALKRPVVVKVDWMCGVYSLQTMVESNRRRPHLREHVVLHQVSFAVHEIQETLRKSRYSNNGTSSRRLRKLEIVASHIVAENPVRLGRIEDGVECDDIGFLANTPLVVVLEVRSWRLGLRRAGKHASVLKFGWAPNRLLIAVVKLLLDHFSEVLPRAVKLWDVVAR